MSDIDYLLAIAKNNGFNSVCISTIALAKTLHTSQQTVSRILKELEIKKLIDRDPSYRGITITITKKGKLLLSSLHKDLSLLFATKKLMKGKIKDGLGEGAWYIKKYAKRIKALIGYTPYFGTLNVSVNSSVCESFLMNKKMRRVSEFKEARRTYGAIDLYEAKIKVKNKTLPCLILSIERTRHASDIIELIAKENIRKEFGLRENDAILLE